MSTLAKSNPSLTYGTLAGSAWFAVYGLTGGFKKTLSVNGVAEVYKGYDPVGECTFICE